PGHRAVGAGACGQHARRRHSRPPRAGEPQLSALLEVRDLEVEIPLAAGTLRPVRGVTLSVERGETLCIVGESGCGKSLTALAIMGLLPRRALRSASRLAPDGSDLTAASDSESADLRGSRMAMIFQEPMTSLNPC